MNTSTLHPAANEKSPVQHLEKYQQKIDLETLQVANRTLCQL